MSVVTGGLVYPVVPPVPVEGNAPTGTSQSIDWSRGEVQVLDLTTASGDVTVTFTNPSDGALYQLIVIRDGGGNDVAAWPSNVRWPNNTPPILQSSNNGPVYDLVHLLYNAGLEIYVGRDLSGAEAFVADGAIGVNQLQNDSVGTSKLQNTAVSTAKLQNNAVTNAVLRDSAALSVVGRSSNTTGDPADIVASASSTYLGRSGNALSFKNLEASDLPSTAVSGIVDFGSGADYAEVTIAAPWVAANSFAFAVEIRGGTADHPFADEDAVIEGLKGAVISDVDEEVTVGVTAPDGTWGQYVVVVIALKGDL